MLTKQQLQIARNLALLARQAISNGFATMQADPKMVADLCQIVESIEATQEAPATDEDVPHAIFRVALDAARLPYLEPLNETAKRLGPQLLGNDPQLGTTDIPPVAAT